MRPSTPSFNFAQQARPSSPPATPTTATFTFDAKKSRRRGIADFHDLPTFPSTVHTDGGTITPNGSCTTFSYNRLESLDISPRSSYPASSHHSSSAEEDSAHAQSRSSLPAAPLSESPPPPRSCVRIVTKANFEVEEFRESDYEQFDSDCESVLRPHQYEDAESEKARSTRASTPRPELDEGVVDGIRDLDCGAEDGAVEEHEMWARKQKEIRRMKRRSSGSVRKRNLTESIGSDTDEEDLQLCEGANEAGSSARRLKRKVVRERTSLIFDDPPVWRIEEVEEPASGEERSVSGKVEEGSDEEESWEMAMPFYGQEDMDIDSDEDDDE